MKLLLENWREYLEETKSDHYIKAVDINGDTISWGAVPKPYHLRNILSERYPKILISPLVLWARQDPRVMAAIGAKKGSLIKGIDDIISSWEATEKHVAQQMSKLIQRFMSAAWFKAIKSFPSNMKYEEWREKRRQMMRLVNDVHDEITDVHQSILLYFLNETQFFTQLISLIQNIKTSGEDICYSKEQIKGQEMADLWKGGCIKDHELKRIILKELNDIQRGIEKYARYPKHMVKKKVVKTGVFGLPAIKTKAK